jgi:AMMECR1 domain-containing protein
MPVLSFVYGDKRMTHEEISRIEHLIQKYDDSIEQAMEKASYWESVGDKAQAGTYFTQALFFEDKKQAWVEKVRA